MNAPRASTRSYDFRVTELGGVRRPAPIPFSPSLTIAWPSSNCLVIRVTLSTTHDNLLLSFAALYPSLTGSNTHKTDETLRDTLTVLSDPIMSTHPRTVKVGIVGSGLAGLTAGYLLTLPVVSKDGKEDVRIEVHLFEKASSSLFGDWRCHYCWTIGAYGAILASGGHFRDGLCVCVYSWCGRE